MGLNTSVLGLGSRKLGLPGGALPEFTGTVSCPNCGAAVAPEETLGSWQKCPFCQRRMEIRVWPVARLQSNAAAALPEQATCFFHPDKAFQACCQRCGRFVCALCDLHLGAEHVCPTCFERGRAATTTEAAKSGWQDRDVLYDSIALSIGWAWIIIWPVIIAAIPAAIVLHVKFRKAPRSYLIPRSGWRFWVAYVGFVWVFLLIAGLFLIPRFAGRS